MIKKILIILFLLLATISFAEGIFHYDDSLYSRYGLFPADTIPDQWIDWVGRCDSCKSWDHVVARAYYLWSDADNACHQLYFGVDSFCVVQNGDTTCYGMQDTIFIVPESLYIDWLDKWVTHGDTVFRDTIFYPYWTDGVPETLDLVHGDTLLYNDWFKAVYDYCPVVANEWIKAPTLDTIDSLTVPLYHWKIVMTDTSSCIDTVIYDLYGWSGGELGSPPDDSCWQCSDAHPCTLRHWLECGDSIFVGSAGFGIVLRDSICFRYGIRDWGTDTGRVICYSVDDTIPLFSDSLFPTWMNTWVYNGDTLTNPTGEGITVTSDTFCWVHDSLGTRLVKMFVYGDERFCPDEYINYDELFYNLSSLISCEVYVNSKNDSVLTWVDSIATNIYSFTGGFVVLLDTLDTLSMSTPPSNILGINKWVPIVDVDVFSSGDTIAITFFNRFDAGFMDTVSYVVGSCGNTWYFLYDSIEGYGIEEVLLYNPYVFSALKYVAPVQFAYNCTDTSSWCESGFKDFWTDYGLESLDIAVSDIFYHGCDTPTCNPYNGIIEYTDMFQSYDGSYGVHGDGVYCTIGDMLSGNLDTVWLANVFNYPNSLPGFLNTLYDIVPMNASWGLIGTVPYNDNDYVDSSGQVMIWAGGNKVANYQVIPSPQYNIKNALVVGGLDFNPVDSSYGIAGYNTDYWIIPLVDLGGGNKRLFHTISALGANCNSVLRDILCDNCSDSCTYTIPVGHDICKTKTCNNTSGTSFAAPLVTAACALLRGYFEDSLSKTPVPEEIYATIINGATYASQVLNHDANYSGSLKEGPVQTYGYGILNVIDAINTAKYTILDTVQDTAIVYNIPVSSGDSLKVTSWWEDWDVSLGPAIIRDLDMFIVDGNDTIYPFTFPSNGDWMIRGPEHQSNKEQIYIDSVSSDTVQLVIYDYGRSDDFRFALASTETLLYVGEIAPPPYVPPDTNAYVEVCSSCFLRYDITLANGSIITILPPDTCMGTGGTTIICYEDGSCDTIYNYYGSIVVPRAGCNDSTIYELSANGDTIYLYEYVCIGTTPGYVEHGFKYTALVDMGANKSADAKTIPEGLNFLISEYGVDSTAQYVIYLYPGVYEEQITLTENIDLSIVGIDNNVTLERPLNPNYPIILHEAGRLHLENLTVKCPTVCWVSDIIVDSTNWAKQGIISNAKWSQGELKFSAKEVDFQCDVAILSNDADSNWMLLDTLVDDSVVVSMNREDSVFTAVFDHCKLQMLYVDRGMFTRIKHCKVDNWIQQVVPSIVGSTMCDTVQIAIVMDASGSMGSHRSAVESAIKSLARSSVLGATKFYWNFAFYGSRCYGSTCKVDYNNQCVIPDTIFTDDTLVLISRMDSAAWMGGTEYHYCATDSAIRLMHWSDSENFCKAIILITDANEGTINYNCSVSLDSVINEANNNSIELYAIRYSDPEPAYWLETGGKGDYNVYANSYDTILSDIVGSIIPPDNPADDTTFMSYFEIYETDVYCDSIHICCTEGCWGMPVLNGWIPTEYFIRGNLYSYGSRTIKLDDVWTKYDSEPIFGAFDYITASEWNKGGNNREDPFNRDEWGDSLWERGFYGTRKRDADSTVYKGVGSIFNVANYNIKYMSNNSGIIDSPLDSLNQHNFEEHGIKDNTYHNWLENSDFDKWKTIREE